MTQWIGDNPAKCDICSKDIKDKFIDGATKMGPWGIMCKGCHGYHGRGFGIGRGQMYEKNPEGKFVKTRG